MIYCYYMKSKNAPVLKIVLEKISFAQYQYLYLMVLFCYIQHIDSVPPLLHHTLQPRHKNILVLMECGRSCKAIF